MEQAFNPKRQQKKISMSKLGVTGSRLRKIIKQIRRDEKAKKEVVNAKK